MSDKELFQREDPTLDQMIACAERELHMRERVYPHWIETRKMSEEKAAHEIHAMQAILDLLKELKEAKGGGQRMAFLGRWAE